MRPRDEPSSRPLLDKLGVRPGMRVAVVGQLSADFLVELRGRVGEVAARPGGRDVVFLAGEERAQLDQMAGLAAGLAAGVVDVKVVHLSDTHSAAKFVVRRVDR